MKECKRNKIKIALEDVSAKKAEKTSLVLDIEKRLNDKRQEKEAKKRKEREKDEKKYTPKTVIVVRENFLRIILDSFSTKRKRSDFQGNWKM